MESMSSSRQLTEPSGAQSVGVSTCHCLGRWEGHSNMIVTAEGPKRASRVSTT